MKTSILFIDDETNILSALKRLLRDMRDEWEMEFALGGREGLRVISEKCFDVVVTDMKMPDVDGVALLQKLQERCPFSVRIILSGQAGESAVIRSLRFSHQYLSKPCEASVLKTKIRKACRARDFLGNPKVKEVASALTTLFILPSTLEALTLECAKSDPSLTRLAEIARRDIGLSAKILQLTHSDYFGKGREFTSIDEAVERLGSDVIRMLLEKAEIFRAVSLKTPALHLDSLTAHAVQVAETARLIAKLEGLSSKEQSEAYTAGLLHEIGRVVLVSEFQDEYQKVLRLLERGGISHHEAEREVFGSSNSEVGAYLLALWGLSDSVIEAVTFQDNPTAAGAEGFRLVTILHAANALEDELRPLSLTDTKVILDERHIQEVNKTEKLPTWRNSTSIHRTDDS
ncbi:MAG: HDOD domain-containing protein [Bdellovibrionales bacterium]|nr:HDOD domain-containing protein [Bdellovibrionales bacterium]